MAIPENIGKWKGIPRDEIEWHPINDESKYVGCGMRITCCGKNVFDLDRTKNKLIEALPLQCIVGCTSCEVWCIFDAIGFPDMRYVKELIKEREVLKR